MPMYEYSCAKHGTFEALRAIEQRAAPARCPDCSARSKRVLSAPRLRGMERSTLIAHERNERSRHEPRVVDLDAAAQRGAGDAGGRGREQVSDVDVDRAPGPHAPTVSAARLRRCHAGTGGRHYRGYGCVGHPDERTAV